MKGESKAILVLVFDEFSSIICISSLRLDLSTSLAYSDIISTKVGLGKKLQPKVT